MLDTADDPGFPGIDMTLEMLCLARIFFRNYIKASWYSHG